MVVPSKPVITICTISVPDLALTQFLQVSFQFSFAALKSLNMQIVCPLLLVLKLVRC